MEPFLLGTHFRWQSSQGEENTEKGLTILLAEPMWPPTAWALHGPQGAEMTGAGSGKPPAGGLGEMAKARQDAHGVGWLHVVCQPAIVPE